MLELFKGVLLELFCQDKKANLLSLFYLRNPTSSFKRGFIGPENEGRSCEYILQCSRKPNFVLLQDLIFYLQSKNINFSGIIEKEELANLIINHINNANYQANNSSTTPNNDFENYTQSFDQIKAQCQSLFNSISDKIASGYFLSNDSRISVISMLFL